MGGVADFVSDTVGGVGDLIGQGTEWLGERSGLGFLDNFGEYVANDENAWIQQLLGSAALAATGYGAYNMLGGGSLLPGSAGGYSLYDMGALGPEEYFMNPELYYGMENPVASWSMEGLDPFTMNELATWEGGLTGTNGFGPLDATGAGPWGSISNAASSLGNIASGAGNWMQNNPLLTLGGLNLLGQYAGARAQQGMADDAWSRQLAAQQAYQATQRADIANAQNTALANWQQYGFPNQGAVQAGINQGKNTIKQNTKTSEQSMNEALAARGVGSGSGAIASAYGDLYKNQQNNIASLTNQMTQFGLTPYSAPPITMAYPGMPNVPSYAQPSSFGERTADMLSGITGQLGGIYAYDWLRNR